MFTATVVIPTSEAHTLVEAAAAIVTYSLYIEWAMNYLKVDWLLAHNEGVVFFSRVLKNFASWNDEAEERIVRCMCCKWNIGYKRDIKGSRQKNRKEENNISRVIN